MNHCLIILTNLKATRIYTYASNISYKFACFKLPDFANEAPSYLTKLSNSTHQSPTFLKLRYFHFVSFFPLAWGQGARGGKECHSSCTPANRQRCGRTSTSTSSDGFTANTTRPTCCDGCRVGSGRTSASVSWGAVVCWFLVG